MTVNFDTNYPQNPWQNVTNKTRDWYTPDLYRIFVGATRYNPFVNMQFELSGLGATQMFIDSTILPQTSTDPIGARDLWLDASWLDSNRRAIVFSQYGGKFAYHKYDNMITFWRKNGVAGLRRLIQDGMGFQISWTLEKLARNAMLSNPFASYGSATGSKFATVQVTDIISTQKIRDNWLRLKSRGTPISEVASFNSPGNVFCITSPGVVADLIDEANNGSNFLSNTFTDIMMYADPSRIVAGEVGTYQRVRFIESNLACLYNCGAITHQTTVTAPITAGDGAPNPGTTAVDGVWFVGQPGATHYVTVASTTGIVVGDIVTLHKVRTNANGVTNGVDYTDGKLQNMRVVTVVSGTQLAFAEPVKTDFITDLGGTVYGYITKGRHIHTATFIPANTDAIVAGIMQPPQIYTPDPVDDRLAQYRFTWDAYLKYQLFNPAAYQVLFLAGSNAEVGDRYIS